MGINIISGTVVIWIFVEITKILKTAESRVLGQMGLISGQTVGIDMFHMIALQIFGISIENEEIYNISFDAQK